MIQGEQNFDQNRRSEELGKLKKNLYIDMSSGGDKYSQFSKKCIEWRKKFPNTWMYCRAFYFFIGGTIPPDYEKSGQMFEDFEGDSVENYIRGLFSNK